METKEIEIRLEKTCSAYPESYDAFFGTEQVGYLRLRWGDFTVEFPDVGGDLLLEGSPNGFGAFDDDEREEWLDKAKAAIVARLIKDGRA
ncbi:hypothetical protein HJA82_29575 [Rhizobium bangladeshense]|nr:hypothetical protein [Rhizobium bangladeshense]